MSVVVNRTTKFICAIEAEDEVPPAGANPTAVTYAERVHWLVAPATSHKAHRFAWHRVRVPLLLASFADTIKLQEVRPHLLINYHGNCVQMR
jgi:hypothetical protein